MSNQPFTVTEFVVTLLGDASVGDADLTSKFTLPAETEMSRDEMEEACEELQALVRKWFGGEKVYVTTPNFQAMEAMSEQESLAELEAVEELEWSRRIGGLDFTFPIEGVTVTTNQEFGI